MAMTLSEVDAKIEALLENPQVDYRIGDKQVSASQKLNQLLKYREHLLKNPTDADLQTIHFNTNVNEFGEEQGEYED
jgi:hypothetical protein